MKSIVMSKLLIKFIFLCGLLINTVIYALPFTISPKAGTQLPTQVNVNGQVFAYYTIANKTHAFRSNNFIKYLPVNVTQITSSGTYPDTCGATFNLSGKGQAGDSCTLQLAITGAVNGQDANPRHHLFACFPGGLTCAGTNFPLNVTQLSAARRNAYITNFSSGDISLCPINEDGSFSLCTITVNPFFNPGGIAVDAAGKYAYILDQFSGVSYCIINNDGNLGACNPTSGIFSFLSGIALHPSGSRAYITDLGSNRVYYCMANINGTLSNCLSTGNGFSSPFGIAINPAGTYAYITDSNSNSVIYCAIDPVNGDLNSCTTAGNLFSFPNAIAINANDTIAYVTDLVSNATLSCPILGDGSFGTCLSTGNGFSGPSGIALH